MAYVGKVTDTAGTTGSVGSTLYGTCTTGASTVAKVVTLASFDKLIDGVTIHVYFTNSNTASSPTLNVNSTGAKTIKRYGSTAPGTSEATSWVAGGTVSFTYDETNTCWRMNDINTNTDTNVTQTNSTADNPYRVLLSGGANDTTQTTTALKSGKLTFNPSTGILEVGTSVIVKYSDTRMTRYTNAGPYFVAPTAGGWAAGMTFRNSADDSSMVSIGGYGSGDTLNHVFIGAYNDPWFKITSTAESTFANTVTISRDDGPLYFISHRTDTNFKLSFGVQSGGTYGGILADTANANRWVLKYDDVDTSIFSRLYTETEATSMYAIPFFGSTPATELKTLLNSNGLRYVSKYGSTSEEGTAQLVLGTGIATGVDANMTGSIRMFSSDAGSHIIKGDATSVTRYITLPADSGTVMLLGTPGVQISANEDLNTSTYYDTTKHFYSPNGTRSVTLSNTPWTETGFQLINMPITSDDYMKQVMIPNDDVIPYLYRYKTPSNTPVWRGPGTGFYFVKGTQTGSTNVWTGELKIPALYDGLTIAYYLPYAGTSSSATLNLTLSTGATTGAVNVYYTGTTRATTHYGAGSTIILTYWSAGSISVGGTATTEARWTRCDYNTNSATVQNIRSTTTTTHYPLLLSNYATGSTSTSAAAVYRVQSIYAQPSTGKITANGFAVTPISGSEQPVLFTQRITGSVANITCRNTDVTWTNYNLILLKISLTGSTTVKRAAMVYLPYKWMVENVTANDQFAPYELYSAVPNAFITGCSDSGFTLGLTTGSWSTSTTVECIGII